MNHTAVLRARRRPLAALITTLVALPMLSSTALADRLLTPVASFDVIDGNGSSVAEIIDATSNGRQLIYTDAENGEIGFVDISDPTNPQGLGTLDVGGEPTSLVIRGWQVLVAVNTGSLAAPAGKLLVINRFTRGVIREFDLGGQPDSIALAPNTLRAAIVIENERDEDLDDGLLPQAPSGTLLILDMYGFPWRWSLREADLSPVAASAPNGDDLEPEYVDINRHSQAVVSFQENNYLAVVDLRTGRTVSHFSAGEVDLMDVDTDENDLIELNSDIIKRREPDAVAWIGTRYFATANEGDYEDENGEQGGSRGFTIFRKDGKVVYESFESFEHLLVSAGHYNEDRSENKGVEPESVEYAHYRGRDYLFVGAERVNAVGVYDVTNPYDPELVQVLPTGIGPEGLKAIPRRGLFVASTESEEADIGIPTMVNIYRVQKNDQPYPTIISDLDEYDLPIPWVALSGLTGDPDDAHTLYAVSDSFLAEGFIYTVDVSEPTAIITDRLQVNTSDDVGLDLEGIAVGPDGHFWLGSEGNAGSRPNLVLKVDASTGDEITRIELPAALVDERRGNGIEGIAVTGAAGSEVIYVAIQRAWPGEGDTDKVNTKIGRYDVGSGEWGFVHYPLEPEGDGDWIGLSELTLLPDGSFAVIERDKGWGPSTGFNAELKAVFRVDLAGATFKPYVEDLPLGSELDTLAKELLVDVLPDLEARSIWTAEKLEGLAVAADGQVYTVTDNDGVDGATGETLFLELGDIAELIDALD